MPSSLILVLLLSLPCVHSAASLSSTNTGTTTATPTQTPSNTATPTQTPSAPYRTLCAGGCTKTSFSTPSTPGYMIFEAPLTGAGSAFLYVELWGAGGANNMVYSYPRGEVTGFGGWGAFASAVVPVTPGEQLRVIAGNQAAGDYNGCGGGGGYQAGRGGGRSGVQRLAGSSWIEILTAGGGGGAGNMYDSSFSDYLAIDGGSAGVFLGNRTQGQGPLGGEMNTTTFACTCGARFCGSDSGDQGNAGGGGGGFCGGCGGGFRFTGGGGGGTSFANTSHTLCSHLAGNFDKPLNFPSTWDGAAGKPNNLGLVVISLLPTSYVSCSTFFSSSTAAPSPSGVASRTAQPSATPRATPAATPSNGASTSPAATRTAAPSRGATTSSAATRTSAPSSGASPSPAPSGVYCPLGSLCTMDASSGRIIESPCPAGSFCTPAGATSNALPCPRGAYCPQGSAAPRLCAGGSFGNATQLTSPGCSGECAPGFWCAAGSTSANAAACPAGSACPGGASAPAACPPGRFSSAAGSPACAPCPGGTFSAAAGATTCAQQCPTGASCPSGSIAPLPCDAGSYNPVPGRATCLLCPAGSWTAATGSIFCDQFCPAGSFSAIPGAKSASACAPCAAGYYTLSDGSSACLPCAAGTASKVIGATNGSVCLPCARGSAQALEGMEECALCAAGTYASALRSLACTPCPFGTFSSVVGSLNASRCLRCPGGLSTATDGASSRAQCLSVPYTCAPGEQQKSLAAPTSAADCAPLVCPEPLFALSSAASACMGCGAGTSGAAPLGCKSCPEFAICPGLTSLPLYNFSSSPSAPSPAPWAECPSLTGLAAARSSLSGGGGPQQRLLPVTSGLLSVDAAVFSSILAGLLLIALFALIGPLKRLPVPAARNAAALFRRAFVAVDGFSLRGAVNIGASPVKHPRPLGGLLWLLGALSFVCFTVVLVLQRASDNVLQQSSIRLLGAEALAAAASLPWAASGPWGGGLRLRVYATGEPGACAAPLAWSTVGLSAGTWRLAVTPSCGASRVSLMEFVCDPCMPTTAAALDVALNFSCQSLFIEAFAMDANGNVSVAAVPPPLTAASAEAGLLSSVSWTVLPFFSVLESSLTDLPPARGFAMTFKDAVATHTALEPDVSGLLATVMPAAATVRLHFDFPLQPFYASTQLSEKRPMSALITSIVGLMGVFSFFGKLLTLLDGAPNIRRILSLKRQPVSREPPAPAQVGEVAVEKHVGVENPLFARSVSQPPEGGGGGAAISAADTAAVWYRESDEEYMWYRNSAGEIAWDLPAGAVLASHPT